MEIVIDAKPLIHLKTGVGYYAFNLIKEFVRINPHNVYYLYGANNILKKATLQVDLTSLFSDISNRVGAVPFPFKKITKVALSLYSNLLLKRINNGIFFGSNFEGFFSKSFKTVITIHDMAHEYYPDSIPKDTLKYLTKRLPEHAQKADLIIAVSENTKRDIIKFLDIPEEKIWTIYNGVSEEFCPKDDIERLDAVKEKYRLPKKFLLYIGAIQPRKNIVGIINAFKLLVEDQDFDCKLVIGGGTGWKNKDVYTTIEALKLKERIVFTPYIPDEDLPYLYNLADVFVFPSFYEGFGFPVLEAMACEVPVVTSNVSSLPEVAGDAAILVDPNSVEDIADGIKKLLTNDKLRKTCVENGLKRAKEFTWEKCAIKTLQAFDYVASLKKKE